MIDQKLFQWEAPAFCVLCLKPNQAIAGWLLTDRLFEVHEHWLPAQKRSVPCVAGCPHCRAVLPVKEVSYAPVWFRRFVKPNLRSRELQQPRWELRQAVLHLTPSQAEPLHGLELLGLGVGVWRGDDRISKLELAPVDFKPPTELPAVMDWKKALVRFWGLKDWPRFEADDDQGERASIPISEARKLG